MDSQSQAQQQQEQQPTLCAAGCGFFGQVAAGFRLPQCLQCAGVGPGCAPWRLAPAGLEGRCVRVIERLPPLPRPLIRRSSETHGFCSVCYKANQSSALAASSAPSPSHPAAPAAAPAAAAAPVPEPKLAEAAPAQQAAEEAAPAADALAAAEAAPADEPADDRPVQVRWAAASFKAREQRSGRAIGSKPI